MLRILIASISQLSQQELLPNLAQLAPHGPRRAAWIAGRVLLSYALYPMQLPDIINHKNGKPAFSSDISLWFNLSHSADDIALAISDEGSVGCDIEVIRPRKNWQGVADATFTAAERQQLSSCTEEKKLCLFWQIWTSKEAILKRHAGQLWQIASVDSASPQHAVRQRLIDDRLCLSVCADTVDEWQIQQVFLDSKQHPKTAALSHRTIN
ncbi:MAG: 4'-phosphopantetheinyl transferase AcpT [Enterovibrio sp.]